MSVTALALLVLAGLAWLLCLEAVHRGIAWSETDLVPPEANQRAEALVRDLLSAEQYSQLRGCGYLDVPSPSRAARVYRVRPSRQPVEVYEDRRLVDLLCVQPVETVPLVEIVVLHKLLIEGAECEYLNVANHLG